VCVEKKKRKMKNTPGGGGILLLCAVSPTDFQSFCVVLESHVYFDLVGVAFEGDMQKSLLLYCVVIALSFGPFAEAIDDPCELRIS
jgi:hypothetical protein